MKMTPEDKQMFENRLLLELTGHVGKTNKIGMGELYENVFGEAWENRINDTRRLRVLVEILRRKGIQVCSESSRSGGGYWIASASSELDDYCKRLRHRALKILSMEQALRKISMGELLGQLRLDLDRKECG